MDIISNESHVLVTDDAGEVLLFDGRVMLQNKSSGDILYVPLTKEICNVFNVRKTGQETNHERCDLSDDEVVTKDSTGDGSNKLWTHKTTVFLIQTIKEMGDKFESEMKKVVYSKLAAKLQTEFQQVFTTAHVESKWKALKRTYKSTIIHNKTSGKQRRKWEYFELMHDVLYHKPEITAPATCSNISGLKVLDSHSVPSTSDTSTEHSEQPAQDMKVESSFSRKRKQRVSDTAKRHAEKMARLDRFNDLFEQMLEKM